MVHSFRAAVFSCFTVFIVHYLCVALFHVALFHGALFPCCNFSILGYFDISLFLLLFMFSSCCTFSMLHSFHVAVFPCFSIPMLLIYVDSFHVPLSSYCTLFMCNVMRELLENLRAIASFSCAV